MYFLLFVRLSPSIFFCFTCIKVVPCLLATPPFSLSLVRSFFFHFTEGDAKDVRSTFKSLVSRLTWMIDWLFDWSTERSPFYASWIVTYLSGARFGWGRSSSSSSPPRRKAFSFFSVLYCLESSVVYSRLYYNKLLWFLVILTFLDPSVYRF